MRPMPCSQTREPAWQLRVSVPLGAAFRPLGGRLVVEGGRLFQETQGVGFQQAWPLMQTEV